MCPGLYIVPHGELSRNSLRCHGKHHNRAILAEDSLCFHQYNSYSRNALCPLSLRLGIPLLQTCLILSPETCEMPLFKESLHKWLTWSSWEEDIILDGWDVFTHLSPSENDKYLLSDRNENEESTVTMEESFGQQAWKVNGQQKQDWLGASFLLDP